ncbi:hypothetical protein BO94DRAFT_474794, partial [Aspergillus sclerotioniger CBS 115572]
LREARCTVLTAENGHPALDYRSGPYQRPHRTLMTRTELTVQVLMPIMSEPEVTHILRIQPPFTTDAKFRNTPVIGLLACGGIGTISEAQRLGFNDFIPSPLKLDLRRSHLRFWTSRDS